MTQAARDQMTQLSRQILAGDERSLPTLELYEDSWVVELEDLRRVISTTVGDVFHEGANHDLNGPIFTRVLLAHARAYWFTRETGKDEGARLYQWSVATFVLEYCREPPFGRESPDRKIVPESESLDTGVDESDVAWVERMTQAVSSVQATNVGVTKGPAASQEMEGKRTAPPGNDTPISVEEKTGADSSPPKERPTLKERLGPAVTVPSVIIKPDRVANRLPAVRDPCFKCWQVGHNFRDCINPRVRRRTTRRC